VSYHKQRMVWGHCMSYLQFLTTFLLPPACILGAWVVFSSHRRNLPEAQIPLRLGLGAVFLHVVIAVLYTTPWDNYLVATRVWWYDPDLVTGVTLGWVPLEEYIFFVLQTLTVGLWVLLLTGHFVGGRKRVATPNNRANVSPLRIVAPVSVMTIWIIAAAVLVKGWAPGTYLALELVWALPPIALQLAYGADILWRNRRMVLLAIVPFTLYLSFADTLAIRYGTWTINPERSVGLLLDRILPVEEVVFFLLTSTLVVFGVTLVLAAESHDRIRRILLRRRSPNLSVMKVNEQ
jgi:lycopene cyclase domain-containing protein